MLQEKDIQKYIYNNLELLPKWLGVDDSEIGKEFSLNKETLIESPAKYILYKKYKSILERIRLSWNRDSLYKFPREYKTAEHRRSKPSIDMLCHTNDPSTFWIIEVKYNKSPERQTLTELLQYSNGLQTMDFPGLPNDSIIFVVVAKEWSNILVQSVANTVFFRGINVLPLIISKDVTNSEQLSNLHLKVFDITKRGVFKHFDKLMFDNDSYCYRLIAFDECNLVKKKRFSITENEKRLLSLMVAHEYSRRGYNGSVIFMEDLQGAHCRYIFALLVFDSFLFDNKSVRRGNRKKCELLGQFHDQEDRFEIDESYARNIIKFIFSNNDIYFESGSEGGRGLSGISATRNLFSWSYPIGWLHEITTDVIRFSREDKRWGSTVFGSDDFNGTDEIFSWLYTYKLFFQDKSKQARGG